MHQDTRCAIIARKSLVCFLEFRMCCEYCNSLHWFHTVPQTSFSFLFASCWWHSLIANTWIDNADLSQARSMCDGTPWPSKGAQQQDCQHWPKCQSCRIKTRQRRKHRHTYSQSDHTHYQHDYRLSQPAQWSSCTAFCSIYLLSIHWGWDYHE